MTSKLKRRRWRRMRDDLACYKAEAKELQSRLMELADEVSTLRHHVLAVSMPVLVPVQTYVAITGEADHALCKKCNDGIRGGCSSCTYRRS